MEGMNTPQVFNSFNVKQNTATTEQLKSEKLPAQEKTPPKKAIIGAAAAIGVAAIAIGGILLHKHNAVEKVIPEPELLQKEVDDVLKMVDDIQKQGKEILDRAQKYKQEAQKTFDKTLLENTNAKNGMYEIEEFISESKSDKILCANGHIYGIQKGIETLSDGTKKTAEEFFFDFNDNLYCARKGTEILPDGTEKVAQEFGFDFKNGLDYAEKGVEKLPDGTEKVAEGFTFLDNAKLAHVRKDAETFYDGTEKIAQLIIFDDNGNLSSVIKGYNNVGLNRANEAEHFYKVVDGTLKEIKPE